MQIVGYMIFACLLSLLFYKDVSTKKTRNSNRSYGERKTRNSKEDRNKMKGTTIATFIIEILSIYFKYNDFSIDNSHHGNIFRNHRRYCFYCFCFNNER